MKRTKTTNEKEDDEENTTYIHIPYIHTNGNKVKKQKTNNNWKRQTKLSVKFIGDDWQPTRLSHTQNLHKIDCFFSLQNQMLLRCKNEKEMSCHCLFVVVAAAATQHFCMSLSTGLFFFLSSVVHYEQIERKEWNERKPHSKYIWQQSVHIKW